MGGRKSADDHTEWAQCDRGRGGCNDDLAIIKIEHHLGKEADMEVPSWEMTMPGSDWTRTSGPGSGHGKPA